mgnify:FL=1
MPRRLEFSCFSNTRTEFSSLTAGFALRPNAFHAMSMQRKMEGAMANFLVSEENEKGFLLEDILISIRKDILERCLKITDDKRPEALHVLSNNI